MVRLGSVVPWVVAVAGCGGGAATSGTAEVTPGAAPPDGTDFHYAVRADPELDRLDVTVCGRSRIDRLVAVEGRVVSADRLAHGECVRYDVDLDEAADSARWGHASEGVVLLPSSAWLWRPAPRDDDATATVRFELPPGAAVSVPWPGDSGVYTIDETAFRFLAHTAFGSFETDAVEVAGTPVAVARLPGELAIDDADVRTYVQRAAEALTTMYGAMPVPRLQVLVVPVGPGSDPVAFGHVGRGGGSSVMLLVRSSASLDALLADWVAVHELSHLAMPFVRREDAWISEGIATYYQEVLSARAGLQSETDAWRAIDRGLAAGRRGGSGRTLRRESADMYRTFAFRRVYWGGTAFALDLDVSLRREGSSLEVLMRDLTAAGRGQLRAWSAEGVLAVMDRAAGSDLPSRVAERHLASRDIPDFDALYARLGIARTEDGSIRLDPSAPDASIRRAIMSAPDGLEDQSGQ